MEIGYYYHILEIGVLYEKGGQRGRFWRFGEQKRLGKEALFWQRILEYIQIEKTGTDCSERLFVDLDKLCRKYRLPNYERILQMKEELSDSRYLYEVNEREAQSVHHIIACLLTEMEKNLTDWNGKARVYRIMAVMHQFPKVMHGKDVLNENCCQISYKQACRSAQGYMNHEMIRICGHEKI